MTDERLQEIERLIEDAGRCFDPVTGQFEPLGGEESDSDCDPGALLGVLGITDDECAEYAQRKMHDYDESA